jgi:hypothetical protein
MEVRDDEAVSLQEHPALDAFEARARQRHPGRARLLDRARHGPISA